MYLTAFHVTVPPRKSPVRDFLEGVRGDLPFIDDKYSTS